MSILHRLVLPRLLGLLLVFAGAGVATLPATSPTTPALAAPVAPPAGPEPQLNPVRFGSPQSISDAGVIIGRARGYFRELGLDVDSLNFQSGPDLIAPLASGELQAGGGNFSLAFLNAVDRGVNIKMVGDKGTGKAGFEFVQFPVRRALLDSGEVRTVSDLRGRRVAVASLRAGAEAIANQVLGTGGLGVDDVELTVLSYPDMLVAFGNNAIDAGVVIEPSLSAGYTRGLMAPWAGSSVATAFGGTYQAGLLYFSGQFAAQTDQARRFMVGYLRGVREYNDAFVKGQGREDVVRMLMDATSMKDPAQYDALAMAGLDPDGRIFRPSLQIELDFFRGRGYYTGSSTIDQIVDTSFAEYAVSQLGPYR